jgi:hypothetical protein
MRVTRLIPFLSPLAVVAAILCLTLGAAAPARAAKPAATPPAAPAAPVVSVPVATTRRVELIGLDGAVFPYSVEIPADWQVLPDAEKKGLWLAPPGGEPANDPRSIFVRASSADLRDPGTTVRSIQENDKKDDTWAAPLVAVHPVGTGGTKRGVLVQMNSGKGVSARSLLFLKLPVGATSVDLIGTAPPALFASLRPLYEKIFFSVQPAGATGAK